MTVVPSLISHPAVPSHSRTTCPPFSLLVGFCPANADTTVAAKAINGNKNFLIGSSLHSRIHAKSSYVGCLGKRCTLCDN